MGFSKRKSTENKWYHVKQLLENLFYPYSYFLFPVFSKNRKHGSGLS